MIQSLITWSTYLFFHRTWVSQQILALHAKLLELFVLATKLLILCTGEADIEPPPCPPVPALLREGGYARHYLRFHCNVKIVLCEQSARNTNWTTRKTPSNNLILSSFINGYNNLKCRDLHKPQRESTASWSYNGTCFRSFLLITHTLFSSSAGSRCPYLGEVLVLPRG